MSRVSWKGKLKLSISDKGTIPDRIPSPLTALSLIVVNLVPLAGVLFFGWSLFSIMLLYWIESGIVGFVNIFKIIRASGPTPDGYSFKLNGRPVSPSNKAFIVAFFTFHYGLFWTVHGIFVVVIFGVLGGSAGIGPSDAPPDFFGGFRGFDAVGVAIAATSLAISHGVSFFVNFLGKQEYAEISPAQQMFRPYSRVVVLHVTILAGALLAGYLGAPLVSLVVMVLLKTSIDLLAHLREHRNTEEPVQTTA